MLGDIFDVQMQPVLARLSTQNIVLDISDEAKNVVIQKGTDLAFGARPLKRAIQTEIVDRVSEAILSGEVT
ncbi:MAG: hypothetical protein U9Q15_01800 [Patescibacteria group bacterium]|nr:hypothetical protein [Patescibacteria group bacterium]